MPQTRYPDLVLFDFSGGTPAALQPDPVNAELAVVFGLWANGLSPNESVFAPPAEGQPGWLHAEANSRVRKLRTDSWSAVLGLVHVRLSRGEIALISSADISLLDDHLHNLRPESGSAMNGALTRWFLREAIAEISAILGRNFQRATFNAWWRKAMELALLDHQTGLARLFYNDGLYQPRAWCRAVKRYDEPERLADELNAAVDGIMMDPRAVREGYLEPLDILTEGPVPMDDDTLGHRRVHYSRRIDTHIEQIWG